MKIPIPDIPEDQKTPLIQILLRIIQQQAEEIALLKEEIARLKGLKPRPKIPPSNVSDDAKNKPKRPDRGNHSHTPNARRQRKKETRVIQPGAIPPGSRFKGYEDYSIQNLRIESLEILLRLAVYIAPDGSRIRGEMPPEYSQGHFGAELIAYCLSQYHQCHVTEPLLLEQLYEMGIDISPAQLSNILIRKRDCFHQESAEVLDAGVKHSDFLNTDDTSARHQGKNGYCTAVGSPLFSYFESSETKSRINFLRILQGKRELYAITEESLNYAFEANISEKCLDALERYVGKCYTAQENWDAFLRKRKIASDNDCRIATEAALIGGAVQAGFDPYRIIISDAAPQFALFLNGLCWVHEERHYRKLVPVSEAERAEVEEVRSAIWDFYEVLKGYKLKPTICMQRELKERFSAVFSTQYESQVLNALLANTRSRQEGLLLVLRYPTIPLHNNDCERDIREYAKKRKISGSSRSADGRRARDTFVSLKKTCKKHGVSFWCYLKDRIVGGGEIPRLADLIAQKSLAFNTS